MKTKNQLIELSLCLVCALTPVSLLTLSATPPSYELAQAADREMIQGKVSAKTPSSLTVDGKMIGTTANTAYMKGGKPVTIADIQTGDRVKVSASKGTDGTLEAVSVQVVDNE